MGSKSSARWWQRLFQRANRSQRKKRDAELGNNPFKSLSRQADFGLEFYRIEIVDEETNRYFQIEIVCTCQLPVVKLGEGNNFYCIHCDRGCQKGTEKCPQCLLAMMDRPEIDLDESEPEGSE